MGLCLLIGAVGFAQPSPNSLTAVIQEDGILLSWKNTASFRDSLEGYEIEYITENNGAKSFSKFLGTDRLSSSLLSYKLKANQITPYEYYTFRIRAIYKKSGKQVSSNYSNELQTIFYYKPTFEKIDFLDSLFTLNIDEKDFNLGVLSASVTIDPKIKVGQMRVRYCGLSEDTTVSDNWKTAIVYANAEKYMAGTLKMDFGNEVGIVYSFELVDQAKNSIRTKSAYANLFFPKGVQIQGIRFGSTQKDYNLISIPLILKNTLVKDIFKDLGDYDPYSWRFFQVNNGNNVKHTEYGNNTFVDWQRSSAYWFSIKSQDVIKGKKEDFFYTGAGITFEKISDLSVTYLLQEGWNAVPNPFNYEVDISAVSTNSEVVMGIFDMQKLQLIKTNYIPKHGCLLVNATSKNQSIRIGRRKYKRNGARMETEYIENAFFDWKQMALLEKPNTENISVFPNPVQNQQQIHFQVQSPQNIQIALFDLLGNKIKDILSQQLFKEGQHQVFWQTQDLKNGIYILRFQNATQTINHKIAIQK